MSKLPPSEPRCWDSKCQAREDCRRWLDRDGPADRHYSIMRPLWQCHTEPCAHYLDKEATRD